MTKNEAKTRVRIGSRAQQLLAILKTEERGFTSDELAAKSRIPTDRVSSYLSYYRRHNLVVSEYDEGRGGGYRLYWASEHHPVGHESKQSKEARVFRRFFIGEERGGVVIVGPVNESDKAHGQVYSVRHLCCGQVLEMSHPQIIKRHHAKAVMCNDCRLEKTAERNSRSQAAKDDAKEESYAEREAIKRRLPEYRQFMELCDKWVSLTFRHLSV